MSDATDRDRSINSFSRQIPFVGRDAEPHDLLDVVGQVLAGQGQVILVVGEPSIGTTWLAEEFAETPPGLRPDMQ